MYNDAYHVEARRRQREFREKLAHALKKQYPLTPHKKVEGRGRKIQFTYEYHVEQRRRAKISRERFRIPSG